MDQLKQTPFALPPLEEQERIVQTVDKQLTWINYLNELITASLAQSKHLTEAILKDAFAGKLVPQNCNDESAEKLLERIKAERLSSKSKNQLELSKYVK